MGLQLRKQDAAQFSTAGNASAAGTAGSHPQVQLRDRLLPQRLQPLPAYYNE